MHAVHVDSKKANSMNICFVFNQFTFLQTQDFSNFEPSDFSNVFARHDASNMLCCREK